MAMIQCPECGQEISDKAKKCIHCGKVLIEEVIPAKFCGECGKEVPVDAQECPYCGCPLESEKVEESKPKSKKKFIIPVIVIAVIAIIAVIAVKFMGTNLSEDEQLAYQNAMDMKSMMKDPDSFKLYDEMFLLKCHDDDGNVSYTYTIFKYGGANGYGAITTDEAIYKDGEFIMNYADEPEEDDSNYMDELGVQLDLALYQMNGAGDTWEQVDIDIEKVKKKMGLD